MAAEANREKLEWAFRTLGLSQGATRKSIEEAYRNQRRTWDPERFKGDPRQQARAIAHLKRLEEAYLALKAQAIPKTSLVEEWYRQPNKTVPADYPADREEILAEPEPGASLVDDIRRTHAAKRFPVWLIVPAALIPVVVGSLLFYQPESAPPPPDEAPSTGLAAEADLAPSGLLEQPILETEHQPPPDAMPGSEVASTVAVAKTPTPEPAPAGRPSSPPRQPAASPVPKSVTGEALAVDETPRLVRAPEILTAAAEREAFELLVLKSPTARDLIQDNNPAFNYVEWQATARDAGQFLISILAQIRETGQPVQLVWAVDTQKQTARAMSQAARDLEAAAARR
jgi:hypothetical protein